MSRSPVLGAILDKPGGLCVDAGVGDEARAVPEVVAAQNGEPTLRLAGEYLEDAADPVAGAAQFAATSQFKDARIVILFGAGLGYRVASLRQAGAAKLVVFEPSAAVRAVAMQNNAAAFEGVKVFTDFAPLRTELIQEVEAEHKLVLLTPVPYQRAFPKELADLVATIKEAQILLVVRRNTLMARSGLIYESAMRNFGWLAKLPLATAMGQPLRGTPAFIVAAGPSLDKNSHLLEQARRKGVLFAVGTSAPAVLAAGSSIDVLTCIETIDQSKNIRAAASKTRVLAVDLSANLANFDVPIERRVLFKTLTPPFLQLGRLLGAPPLPYGGSVATAAFALARLWGADPIVLLGQDLGYTDGRAYARGTGREHFVAKLVPGGGLLVEDGGFFNSELDKAGITTRHKARPVVFAPAWGGTGEVPTTHDLLLFGRWFESAAYEFAGKHRLINATEGGVSVRGFAEQPLEDVLRGLSDRDNAFERASDAARPLEAHVVEQAKRELVESAQAIASAARGCASARSASARTHAHEVLREAGARAQLVQAMAEPELKLIMADRTLATEIRARRTYKAIENGARRVIELLK